MKHSPYETAKANAPTVNPFLIHPSLCHLRCQHTCEDDRKAKSTQLTPPGPIEIQCESLHTISTSTTVVNQTIPNMATSCFGEGIDNPTADAAGVDEYTVLVPLVLHL